MRILPNIKPSYIIWIAATVAVLVAASGLFELKRSREDLYHVRHEEALSLSETIVRSGINNLLATDEIERLLGDRLLNNALLIARLDSVSRLSSRDLQTFAAANELFRINIFNGRGQKVLSSYTPVEDHADRQERFSPAEILRPLMDGTTDRLILGLKEARHEDGERFAVAVRRTRPGGGAVVVNLDANELLAFRRKIGIGKFLGDLGDNSEVVYVALQDRQGIIAAGGDIEELSSIEADTVLATIENADTVIARVVPFRGTEVYEVVRQFDSESTPGALCRIALATDEIRATESRMIRRVVLSSILLIAIGVLALTFIVANQNLRNVEHNYRSIQTFTGNILNQMQDAVVTVDASGTVTLFNARAEELFGVPADVVVGKRLGNQQPGLPPGLLLTLSFSEPHSEQQIDCGNGATRTVAVTLSRTRTRDGLPESTTAVIRDLTEARRLEQEMQRKDRLSAMGELASGVAHEIRNPLNAISMIAQRFEKEFSPRQDAAEYRSLAAVLKSEIQRVNGIIRQFLRFARPPVLQVQRISIDRFLGGISTLFAGQAAAKGIRFTAPEACEGDTRIDPDQMSQALMNLLQNALEATEGGGAIDLACRREQEGLIITVTDTGCGMTTEQMQKIFNLYYTTKPEGTGIGLPIAQQVITMHQGSLHVESEPGRGSRFVIRLP